MQNIGDRLSWIRELVAFEEQLETAGVVDLSAGHDSEKVLSQETLTFMADLKNLFIEASSAFNHLKASPLGRIKIYGIAKTPSDFMLFRNGYKMIFSAIRPGMISVKFNFSSSQTIPTAIPALGATSLDSNRNLAESLLEAQVSPLGDAEWLFQGKPLRLDSLVRYHMSVFVRESAK